LGVWLDDLQTLNDHTKKTIAKARKLQNMLRSISNKYFRPGGMAPSKWTHSIRAVSDTPVADYFPPGLNTMHHVAYRSPISVSPVLLALSVSYFKRTLWR